MSNKIAYFGIFMFAACLLVSGCGRKPYKHNRLAPGDAEFGQIESMIEFLRKSTSQEAAAKQGVSDLAQDRKESLLYCLESIKQADNVKLLAADSFGPKIYRASMELENRQGKTNLTMLLLQNEDGMLMWLGPN